MDIYLVRNNELIDRYNCNRYDEEEAKKARDAQEVSYVCFTLEQVAAVTVCVIIVFLT